MQHSAALSKYIYHNDIVIGAVACRVEDYIPPTAAADASQQQQQQNGHTHTHTHTQTSSQQQQSQPSTYLLKRIYIMTLGVLPHYRSHGIGRRLLQHILTYANQQNQSPTTPAYMFHSIYLHVWTVNNDGINFYKHYGFKNVGELKQYYKHIQPPDCYILEKQIMNKNTESSSVSDKDANINEKQMNE
jgi:ribosomal protein S18 acetylase RimI-like enzyme